MAEKCWWHDWTAWEPDGIPFESSRLVTTLSGFAFVEDKKVRVERCCRKCPATQYRYAVYQPAPKEASDGD